MHQEPKQKFLWNILEHLEFIDKLSGHHSAETFQILTKCETSCKKNNNAESPVTPKSSLFMSNSIRLSWKTCISLFSYFFCLKIVITQSRFFEIICLKNFNGDIQAIEV